MVGGLFSPAARAPQQQSRAGNVPGPQRRIHCVVERVVLADKICPFTLPSDFMTPLGA